MSIVIDDRRKDPGIPWAFVVATDSFLSGWGDAPGRSLFALEAANPREAEVLMNNLRARSEMQRPRIVGLVRRDGRYIPSCRLREDDHLSIRDRREADRFYTPGGFREGGDA